MLVYYDTATVPLVSGECTTTTDLKLTYGSQATVPPRGRATVPPDCAPRLCL